MKECVRMAEGPNKDFCFEGTVKSLKLEINILKSRTLDKRNKVCRVPISYLVTKPPISPSIMSISGHLRTALNAKRTKSIANELISMQFTVRNKNCKGKVVILYI